MLVSLVKPNAIHPEKGYAQNKSFATGTLLEQVKLEQILYGCSKISKASEKGINGAIFPYISGTIGRQNWKDEFGCNDGVIFVDIDHITKDVAETIFNNFELLCEAFPCLCAIQYSSSYYLPVEKNGLHIYVASGILNEYEYKYLATLSLAIFARVVYTKLGIDLRKPMIGDDIILDEHSTHLTQRFFLYYSEFKYNEYCEIITNNILNNEQLSKLKSEYKELDFNNSVKLPIKLNLDITDGGNAFPKLCINKHLKIGKWTGNDIRWRISRIAQALFGEDAQQWCDKYFYCIDENTGRQKTIYTKQREVDRLSPLIKDWLEEHGYLASKTPNLIRQGEYITKYKNKIIDFIKNNKRTEIIAPTGTGKTSLINGCKDYRYDLFNQDKDMMFSLAHEMNAIVIVPFNVTNKLYDNMIEISSENDNKVKDDQPCVMIWDKAIQHWGEIKNRFLIIDEAHCLFLDRRYRDKAILLMNNLKNDNCHFVLFTATPSGEGEELQCKYLKFINERKSIKADFINVNNVDIIQYKFIVNCLRNKWYDRIVLFDDTTAKKIYEKIYCDGEFIDDVAYIRADTKNSPEFKQLRETELLNKKLTICTCVAFNGLNFKNENENILVVTSYQKGNTTASEIIQEAGRIRKSNVYLKVYYDNLDRTDNLEHNINKANILHKAEIDYDISEGLLQYDNRLIDGDTVESLRNINNYINSNSDIDIIIDTLQQTNYFIIKKTDMTNSDSTPGNRMVLALKRKESNEFVNDMMNDDMINKEYDEQYKMDWQHQIKKIINNDTYIGVTLDTIKELYNKSDKQTLISTTIQKLHKIIYISLLDDVSWNNYINNIEKVKKMLGSDTIAIKQVTTSFKQNQKIRNQYKNKIKANNNVIDLSLMFDDIIFEMEEQQTKQRQANIEGGKKGHCIILDGVEYKTVSDAAKALNMSRKAIYHRIKTNKI